MTLGEEQEEIGQFRVGQWITGGDEEAAYFLTGRQGQAQAAQLLRPVGEGPAFGAVGRRPPSRQGFLAALAKFLQEIGQQAPGPHQSPVDPAAQLLGVGETSVQYRQRFAAVDEGADGGEDATETGRLVWNERAWDDAPGAAVRQQYLLDGDGALPITGNPQPTAIASKGAKVLPTCRFDQSEPGGMVPSR